MFYLALVSSLSVFAVEEKWFLVSFGLFLVFALAYSFVKRQFFPAASLIFLLAFPGLVWFSYILLDTVSVVMFVISAVAGGAFGRAGVRRCGDIIFILGLIFVALAFIFGGEKSKEVELFILPIFAFCGVASGAVAGKKPFATLLSCVIGGLAGLAVRFGGGVFDEIYLYGALFSLGAGYSAFVISGFRSA